MMLTMSSNQAKIQNLKRRLEKKIKVKSNTKKRIKMKSKSSSKRFHYKRQINNNQKSKKKLSKIEGSLY